MTDPGASGTAMAFMKLREENGWKKNYLHWDQIRISEMLRHGAIFHEIGDILGRTTESAKHIARMYHL